MKAETIHGFSQVDADEYLLTWNDGEEDYELAMGSFEAVRLYNLVVKQMVGYITEMEIAKASYERGEGPNGEPRGTWEQPVFACNDPEGEWIRDQEQETKA